MNTTPEYCHFTEEQIGQSQLLSPERFQQLIIEVNSRIMPVCTLDGKEIPMAKLAVLGEGNVLLFARLDNENSVEYMRRTIWSAVLTPNELALINRHALDASELHKDEERFAKAQKLDSWDGGAWWGDKYFASMEELCDEIVSGGDEWPKYVWAAEGEAVIPPNLDAADITENYISDRGWEDMDLNDLEGVPELNVALKAFAEANKGVNSFRPDYSKAVLLAAWRAAETGD